MNAKITVLEIVGNAIVGGMEMCVARLVARLPPDRFSVVCLCPFESAFTRELRCAGALVYITPLSDNPYWESIQYAATLVRLYNIQVIHAHLPNAHILAGLVSALTGVPAFATVHGRGISPLDFEISRTTSTHLSVVCQSARIHALALGVPEERVHVIANGVDSSYYATVDEGLSLHELFGIEETAPIVGFVGRLAPEKGPDVFVRMVAFVRSQLPGVHFVLVGEGPMRNALERLVLHAGVGDRVHFAGLQREMRAIYQAMSLLVSSSHSEGMPLALMEGMASGLATVAASVGGVPEVVEAGKTGLLVPPGDAELLAQAVVMLLQDDPRRRAFGDAARERVRALFPLDRSVADTAALMTRLAVARAPRKGLQHADYLRAEWQH